MTAESSTSSAAPGTVGEELARLLQALAERSTEAHPIVHAVRDHPEVVEQATDTLVSWIRCAQDTVDGAVGGHR